MIIKTGKHYRARIGVILGPLRVNPAGLNLVRYYHSHWSWDENGRCTPERETDFDLIEEVEVTPVTPKTATFYVAAYRSPTKDEYFASVCRSAEAFGPTYGPAVAVELELPPKPEGTKL